MGEFYLTFTTVSAALFWGSVLATALTLIPFCRFAMQFGMADYPDRFRKLHRKPVPVGGAVLFAVTVLLLAGTLVFQPYFSFSSELSVKGMLPLFIAAAFLAGVGVIDDKWRLNGTVKLFCQILAASVIVGFTEHPTCIVFFGWSMNLHHLFYPFAVFWLVGMINSINLLDGADGVASTASFFLAVSAALLATVNGHFGIALCCFILMGSIVGFFLHNCPPASVYLGDTGSMFLGLMLGTLLLQSSAAPDGTVWVCAPLAAVLIPAVDVFFAIIRRANLGRPVFSPDRGHLHHLLYQRFSSEYLVLLLIALLILPGCVGAVAGMVYRNDSIPVAVSAVVLGIALLNDLFGRRELLVLFGRIKNLLRKQFNVQHYTEKDGEVYQIQGKGRWKMLWHLLVADVKKLRCRRCSLNINMPYRNENFFANWENPDAERYDRNVLVCNVDLAVGGRSIGTVYFAFDNKQNRNETLRAVAELARMCENFVEMKMRTMNR